MAERDAGLTPYPAALKAPTSSEEFKDPWAHSDSEKPSYLSEDTSSHPSIDEPKAPPLLFTPERVTRLPKSLGEAISDESSGPIRFRMSSTSSLGKSGDNLLRAAFAALGRVRSSAVVADWIEAAATLKGEAVRLRQTQYSRHSAVLLALADALTFSQPSEGLLETQSAMVDRSLALLSEPYISEPDEEDFLVDLMSHGWKLAPASTGEPLT